MSTKKRIRQNEKKRTRNKSIRSEVRNCIKRLRAAHSSEGVTKQDLLKIIIKKLDKAVSKGVYHMNTASRYKSRLICLVAKVAE